MAITGAAVRANALIVELDAAGAVVAARLTSSVVKDPGGGFAAVPNIRTFTRLQALGASVTGAQLAAMEAAAEALRATLATELLG